MNVNMLVAWMKVLDSYCIHLQNNATSDRETKDI